MNVTKICIDPHCETVWHNCPKKHTRCENCEMLLVEINKETYMKKFAFNPFQFDCITKEFYFPNAHSASKNGPMIPCECASCRKGTTQVQLRLFN